MRAPIEEPTLVESSDLHGTTHSHPAYAQIRASRISGGRILYGSDFQHQNYVRVSIHQSQLRRNLSNDWPHAELGAIVEVDMSEAQWATFVSSMNVGSGTQCTLNSVNGEMIAQLPPPPDRKDQFKTEATERAQMALDAMKELAAQIDATSLSQKAKVQLHNSLRVASSQLTSALPFVLEQFGEHMETTVEKAKIEINAYVTQNVLRAGLGAIAGEKPALSIGFDGGASE